MHLSDLRPGRLRADLNGKRFYLGHCRGDSRNRVRHTIGDQHLGDTDKRQITVENDIAMVDQRQNCPNNQRHFDCP